MRPKTPRQHFDVHQTPSPRFIINLSAYKVSSAENFLLAKGLNFSLVLKSALTEDIINAVESSIRRFLNEAADIVRFETAKIQRIAKVPRHNITKEENQTLRELKADPTIVILRAAKGNDTVILNKSDYIEKITDLLNDGCHQQLSSTKQEITSLLKYSDISIETLKDFIAWESTAPRLYELPKIHKLDIPLRP